MPLMILTFTEKRSLTKSWSCVIMDMIFHHDRSVKSVQTNSDSTTFVSEYVVVLNCGHIAVSQEDSPALVGENQVSSNIHTSRI